MAAPQIKINGGSPGVKASLAATTQYTATLDSTAGVKRVEWAILSTDETSAVDDYTLVQSGTVGQTVTFTSLDVGTAALLWVRINSGINAQTGIADATATTATCKFYVPCAGGAEVGAAGEKMESDPTFGSTALLNRGIRAADALNVGQYDAPYLTRTANVLLTDATAIDDIESTVEFESTTVTPFGTKRTSSATTALVDVEQVTALSSGTAAAGFGPATKYVGEVSGGGVENYGRIGFAATDLTASSEDTKFVAQARTAGAALATVVEISGTAIKVPALAGSGSTNVEVDGDGNLTRGAGSAIGFSDVETALSGLGAGVLHEDGAGNLTSSEIVNADVDAAAAIAGTKISPDFGSQNVQTTGSVTAGTNGFVGPQLNRATSGTFTLGSNITTLAGTALAVTGIASIDNSGGALTVGANTTGQTIGKASTTAAFVGDVSVAGTLTVPGVGSSSERLGASTTAAGANSVAHGNAAKADSSGSIAIGQGTQITGSATDTICIGRGITTTSAQGIAIGASASNWVQAVGIGSSVSPGSSSVAIGHSAGASTSQTVSIGRSASAGGTNNIAIGYNSNATGSGSATESIAIGAAAATGYTNCIAIGGGASCTAANQALIGGANCSITDLYIGKGVTHATPAAVTVQPTGGSTSGVTGANLTIAGGKGGVAADAGGTVNIQTAAAGSGTTLETRMSFAASGARTDSAPQQAIIRRQFGAADTNYTDITGLSTTPPQSATTTIYTYSTTSNTYVQWDVYCHAYDTAAPDQCRWFGIRIFARNNSGTLTSIATADIFTAQSGGVWVTPPSLAFSVSGTNILLQATAPALDIKFTVTESKMLVNSTSA